MVQVFQSFFHYLNTNTPRNDELVRMLVTEKCVLMFPSINSLIVSVKKRGSLTNSFDSICEIFQQTFLNVVSSFPFDHTGPNGVNYFRRIMHMQVTEKVSDERWAFQYRIYFPDMSFESCQSLGDHIMCRCEIWKDFSVHFPGICDNDASTRDVIDYPDVSLYREKVCDGMVKCQFVGNSIHCRIEQLELFLDCYLF